jgi:hypothetical protein
MPQTRATCKVTIRGSFDVRWVDYLGDMLLHAHIAEGHVQTTTLFAKPPDLAAFIGMLTGLADFGFLVIACEYRRPDVSEEVGASGGSTTRIPGDARDVGSEPDCVRRGTPALSAS